MWVVLVLLATQVRVPCSAEDSAQVCLDAGLQRTYEGATEGQASLRMACEKHSAQACFHDLLVEHGQGNESRPLVMEPQGYAALQSRCGVGQAVACHHLALLHLDGPMDYRDTTQGKVLLRQACESGASDACLRIAEPLLLLGTEQGERSAVELYQRGCDSGHARSCLAWLDHLEPQSAQAKQVSAQACAAGASSTCD